MAVPDPVRPRRTVRGGGVRRPGAGHGAGPQGARRARPGRPPRVAPRRRRRHGPRRPLGGAGRAGAGPVAGRQRPLPGPRPDPGHHRAGRCSPACGGSARPCRVAAATAAGGAGPGRPRRRGAPGEPRRLDAVLGPSPGAAGGPAAAGARRGVRRRADDGVPPRARRSALSRRSGWESSRSRSWRPPADIPTERKVPEHAFRRNRARTNVCAWSPSGSVVAPSGSASSDPEEAIRPGKPMPVAGETVHVTAALGSRDHGAA